MVAKDHIDLLCIYIHTYTFLFMEKHASTVSWNAISTSSMKKSERPTFLLCQDHPLLIVLRSEVAVRVEAGVGLNLLHDALDDISKRILTHVERRTNGNKRLHEMDQWEQILHEMDQWERLVTGVTHKKMTMTKDEI